MGKQTGFLEYEREDNTERAPLERIKDFNEFHIPLDQEKRKEQAARCMNCGVPFCQWGQPVGRMVAGCPLNNLVPEFNDALYRGNKKQALQRLLMTNNFPEFTSRVCPALCEKACTCGLNGDPVSTKDNEYDIIESAFANGDMQADVIQNRSEKNVAVVGSGPSGLAAADQLNKRGHHVTVYEKSDRFGGLLMYGIPNMKLDKQIVERRIELMRKEGVRFVNNTSIETKAQAEELLKKYDAVVLCCGTGKARSLNVEGMDAKGIYFAVDFLSMTTAALLDHREPLVNAKKKHVVIVGGGDTGNDCAATCVRQGCSDVVQLEMMPEPPLERTENNPWPEWPLVKKTDYGQNECIAVFGKDPRFYETSISKIYSDGGRIDAVDIVNVKMVKGEDGKMSMQTVEGSTRHLPCDLLLIAAGFLGCADNVANAFGVETDRGRVKADGYYVKNNLFTAGDMHRGQSLVVHAINEGRKCAEQVDQYLIEN
jgi:glutamate synthase (NADPH/NADH) small chain